MYIILFHKVLFCCYSCWTTLSCPKLMICIRNSILRRELLLCECIFALYCCLDGNVMSLLCLLYTIRLYILEGFLYIVSRLSHIENAETIDLPLLCCLHSFLVAPTRSSLFMFKNSCNLVGIVLQSPSVFISQLHFTRNNIEIGR